MRGISAILATVLIVVITVAIIGMAYGWATGLFRIASGASDESAENIISNMQKSVQIVATKCSNTTGTIQLSAELDFVINETDDFNAGIKINTTTITDRFNQSAGTLEMDFPYTNKTEGLIAYWRFEGNLNNEVGQALEVGNAGVYNTTDGIFGQAYTFDGVNDYLYLDDNDIYDMITTGGSCTGSCDVPFTVQYWARPHTWTDGVSKFGLMVKGNGFTNPAGWIQYIYNGKNRLYVIKSDTTKYEGFYTGITDWSKASVKMLTYTYDGRGGTTASAGMTYYKNATNTAKTNDDSGAYANMSDNSYPLQIGGITASSIYLDGEMDEVQIYRGVALTQAQIDYFFNNGKQYIDTAWGDSASTWTSDTQIMTEDYLNKIRINVISASASGYITRIEILKASDSSLIASNETDITTSGLVTYSTANGLDYGNFANADEDFKIKLYLAGDGSATPIIDDIIGYYHVEEEDNQIPIQAVYNYLTFTIKNTGTSDIKAGEMTAFIDDVNINDAYFYAKENDIDETGLASGGRIQFEYLGTQTHENPSTHKLKIVAPAGSVEETVICTPVIY